MAQEMEINPRDPEAARAELERTRARMSDTIDEIEDVLLKKKQDLHDRLDVRARIRDKPLHAAGIVIGVGFLIGFLTGGGSDAKDRRLATDARAALWEARARRLLRIAREQESDIGELESTVAELEAQDEGMNYWVDDLEYEEPSRFEALRESVRDRATQLVGEAARAILENVRTRL
jgi:ElaB/YqjD/DUF883 family membrane-anchored ribosome-binding protein